MAVILINPNSTEAMTTAMLAAARAAAPGLEIEGWTSHDAPPAIQGAEDGARAAPPLLKLIDKAVAEGAQGIIIGCFDDTALAEAAARAPCPVIGIGQAAYHEAALRSKRFSVITTLPISVPVLEGNIATYGLAPWLGRVRPADVPVLELDRDPEAALGPIGAAAQAAIHEDGIEALILGCAGMVLVTRALRAALPVTVIDPVESAARAMGWLAAPA
ncbi:aspartate/glutamate racemase family protein [Litorisediminicola beolgyonensis]|uniref:Aspartate/glutamate racemase family protein n=1 Tax=Litorisediminicola beolgyonensis TaxID=1173614 RepID=A0ABW3ZG42_9RHOB